MKTNRIATWLALVLAVAILAGFPGAALAQFPTLRYSQVVDLRARAQLTADMTLYVNSGIVYVNGTWVSFAGGNSPAFSAPGAPNNRIDLLTINRAGTLAITQGTAAVGPTRPAVPPGLLPIAYVYVKSTSTSIWAYNDGVAAHGYLLEETRPFVRSGPIGSVGGADELTPPYMVGASTVAAPTAGEYADSGAGNILQQSSWVRNTGSRAAVATFGMGIANGATARAWGGNFVSYATVAGGTANGVEVNFGALAAGGLGSGILIAHCGQQNTSNPYFIMQDNGNGGLALYGMAISSRSGVYPPLQASGTILATLGAITVAKGIDLTSTTFTTSAFSSTGYVLTPEGYVQVTAAEPGTATSALFRGYDATAQAAGVGGRLLLGGKYTDAGDYTGGVAVKASKGNATSTNDAYNMLLQTKPNGGALTTALTLWSDQTATLASSLNMPGGSIALSGGSRNIYNSGGALYIGSTHVSGILHLAAYNGQRWQIDNVALFPEDVNQTIGKSANYVPGAYITTLNMAAGSIVTDTTTGLKIATGTTQKLGFFNVAPVVQQAHIADPAGGATVDAEARAAINSILLRLETFGFVATS